MKIRPKSSRLKAFLENTGRITKDKNDNKRSDSKESFLGEAVTRHSPNKPEAKRRTTSDMFMNMLSHQSRDTKALTNSTSNKVT